MDQGLPKLGVLFWSFGGCHHKDYTFVGSALGSPISGNYHVRHLLEDGPKP